MNNNNDTLLLTYVGGHLKFPSVLTNPVSVKINLIKTYRYQISRKFVRRKSL